MSISRIFLAAFIAATTLIIPAVTPLSAGAEEATFMAVGDILPHASWQNFELPADKLMAGVVAEFFGADVVMGNLETALTDSDKPTSAKTPLSIKSGEEYLFKTESEDAAEGMKNSGFTVLTLSNNQVMDYREDGLDDTIARLDRAGIKTAGAGKDIKAANAPANVKARGVEFVILSASDVAPKGYLAEESKPGVASMRDEKAYVEKIKAERAMYPDAILVLSLHWGVEAMSTPTARQKKLARMFIDAGADVIIGHHPHRIQGIEVYKDRPIFYSLGNFQYDSKEPADRSMIAKLVYDGTGHVPVGIEVIPVRIMDGGYPVVLDPEDGMFGEITGRVNQLSSPFGVMVKDGLVVPIPKSDNKGYDYWGS